MLAAASLRYALSRADPGAANVARLAGEEAGMVESTGADRAVAATLRVADRVIQAIHHHWHEHREQQPGDDRHADGDEGRWKPRRDLHSGPRARRRSSTGRAAGRRWPSRRTRAGWPRSAPPGSGAHRPAAPRRVTCHRGSRSAVAPRSPPAGGHRRRWPARSTTGSAASRSASTALEAGLQDLERARASLRGRLSSPAASRVVGGVGGGEGVRQVQGLLEVGAVALRMRMSPSRWTRTPNVTSSAAPSSPAR